LATTVPAAFRSVDVPVMYGVLCTVPSAEDNRWVLSDGSEPPLQRTAPLTALAGATEAVPVTTAPVAIVIATVM
jgi:hypothetical protein